MKLLMLQTTEGRVPVADTGNGRLLDLAGIMEEAEKAGLLNPEYSPSLDQLLHSPDPRAAIEWVCEKSAMAGEWSGEGIPDIPVRDCDIFCVGRNYAAHARELNNPVPSEPVLFMKPRTTLIPSGSAIVLAPDSECVELEGELALVIGHDLSGKVSSMEAAEAVVGVTLFNDVTDRARQARLKAAGKPWLTAKGRRTFGPCGPAMLVVENPKMLDNLTLETELNGEKCQAGSVADWLWSPGELVAYIAFTTGIRSGDLIATGTPAGVREIREGDRVVVSSPLIGRLENHVAHAIVASGSFYLE